jgi:hypothetical protein
MALRVLMQPIVIGQKVEMVEALVPYVEVVPEAEAEPVMIKELLELKLREQIMVMLEMMELNPQVEAEEAEQEAQVVVITEATEVLEEMV